MKAERLADVLDGLAKKLRESGSNKKVSRIPIYTWFAKSAGEMLQSLETYGKDLEDMSVEEAARHGFESGQESMRHSE